MSKNRVQRFVPEYRIAPEEAGSVSVLHNAKEEAVFQRDGHSYVCALGSHSRWGGRRITATQRVAMRWIEAFRKGEVPISVSHEEPVPDTSFASCRDHLQKTSYARAVVQVYFMGGRAELLTIHFCDYQSFEPEKQRLREPGRGAEVTAVNGVRQES